MSEQHTNHMTAEDPGRAEREILHGRLLAAEDTERIWGWATDAGKKRALRRADLIIAAARMDSDLRVLEIGCGTGLFTESFAETGAEIVAIDISRELIDRAKERSYPQGNVQFICQRLENLVVDEPFDAVVGSSILHHLDIEKGLAVIVHTLTPGGRIAFAEPNMLNPQIFMERTFLRERLSHVSPDETAFVRWSFRHLLQNYGFEDVTILPFDWLHPYTPRVLIPMVSMLGQLFERIPGIREFAGSLLIAGRRG